jgi:hypothetical protein
MRRFLFSHRNVRSSYKTYDLSLISLLFVTFIFREAAINL